VSALGQWIEDLRWAANMIRARRWRREIGFSARIRFDNKIRHPVEGGVIAYPDAFYHVEIEDLCRATMESVVEGKQL